MILRLTLLERALHRMHLLPVPVMDAFAGVLFGRLLCIGVRRGIIEAAAGAPCPAPAPEPQSRRRAPRALVEIQG